MKNSLRFMVLTTVFLIVSISFIKIGFTNEKKSTPLQHIQILAGAIDVEGELIQFT